MDAGRCAFAGKEVPECLEGNETYLTYRSQRSSLGTSVVICSPFVLLQAFPCYLDPSTTWPRLRTQLIPQEELCNEYAEYFRGKSEAELDELAKSFALENCLQRERLNAILSEDSKRAAAK